MEDLKIGENKLQWQWEDLGEIRGDSVARSPERGLCGLLPLRF